MKETKKMMNILNQNKTNKQKVLNEKKRQEMKRQEKRSTILTICGYIVATYVFVQLITLLVK